MRGITTTIGWLIALAALAGADEPASHYDLLLQGGHVIDPKSHRVGPADLAIWGGHIARVEREIPASQAKKVVNVAGLYVIPGLVDLHVHVFTGTGQHNLAGDLSVAADAHCLRSGVTTAVDAGTSGRRTFPAFKHQVVDRSRTRVLAWLNIVGKGMSGRPYEQDTHDMDPAATAALALQYPLTVVGIKTAHYDGPEWIAVERALEAARLARLPVMVDFGTFRPERPYPQLVLEKLRPGDISTHMYVDLPRASVPLFDSDGRLLPYLSQARGRGVKFDVGHGFESFAWARVVPAVKQGWLPDTISSDLYARSMNAGLKDMANLLSKFLSLDVPLPDVIRMATWTPAQEIHRPDLGHLDVGAGADVAVFRLHTGEFGYLDVRNMRRPGKSRLECELTLRDGQVVWDLNGRAGEQGLSDHSTPRDPAGARSR